MLPTVVDRICVWILGIVPDVFVDSVHHFHSHFCFVVVVVGTLFICCNYFSTSYTSSAQCLETVGLV